MPPRVQGVFLRFGWTLCCAILAGCGTTRWTDTSRTGTEQLLLSDAVDRAVSEIDFRPLAGKTVYFDPQYLKITNPLYNFDDHHYLVSSLRQQILASGCILKDKREDAEYVIEARAGAVGTDRHDLLYGIPATNLGALAPVQGVPAAIPEIPLAKRTSQRGVAKIAVFAYRRDTGVAVWQSGVNQVASDAKNTWVFGIGPFQSGSIFRGTAFAGREISNPLSRDGAARDERPVWTTKQAFFEDPQAPQIAQRTQSSESGGKQPAGSGAEGPATVASPPPKPLPPATP